MNEQFEDYIQEAIELVDAWELSGSELAEAINSQAKLMAGMGLESSTALPIPSPYSTLQF